jgi:small subunit ribosomal protein S21
MYMTLRRFRAYLSLVSASILLHDASKELFYDLELFVCLPRSLSEHGRKPVQPDQARLRGVIPLAEIRVQEGEPLENALRRFKRKVQTEDIIKEVKRHSFYLKPGEKKRVKEALARKRNRKKVRKEQD